MVFFRNKAVAGTPIFFSCGWYGLYLEAAYSPVLEQKWLHPKISTDHAANLMVAYYLKEELFLLCRLS